MLDNHRRIDFRGYLISRQAQYEEPQDLLIEIQAFSHYTGVVGKDLNLLPESAPKELRGQLGLKR